MSRISYEATITLNPCQKTKRFDMAKASQKIILSFAPFANGSRKATKKSRMINRRKASGWSATM